MGNYITKREEFAALWNDLISNEQHWVFSTLIALQPCACVAHQGGCIVRANDEFAQYLGIKDPSNLIGQDLRQYVLMVGQFGHVYNIEPHPLHTDNQIVRLLLVKPLVEIYKPTRLEQGEGGGGQHSLIL